mmetsp:Transcript_17499/g.24913  ORF Transcript_17499/g.24913 Transcript_17499/m.24913 type:complete len:181 (-) Transcript_17499:526-1068(-)
MMWSCLIVEAGRRRRADQLLSRSLCRHVINTRYAWAEATTDLVMNLFKGYRKAKDKIFRNWLQREFDDYITRRTVIHPNGLDFMEQVENYYKDRLNSGEWMKLDDEQEIILQRSPHGDLSPPNQVNRHRRNATARLGTGVSTTRNGRFIPPASVARKKIPERKKKRKPKRKRRLATAVTR